MCFLHERETTMKDFGTADCNDDGGICNIFLRRCYDNVDVALVFRINNAVVYHFIARK